MIFFGFFIFDQINTARGLDVEMTMRDESDEENGKELMSSDL
jgi:ribosomal protein L5